MAFYFLGMLRLKVTTRAHSDTHSLFSHTLVSLHLSLLHCWCKANILKFYQHMVRVFEPLPSHPYSPASISFLLRRDSPTNCWLPYLATRYQHRATSTWLHYDLHAPSSCTSDFLLFFFGVFSIDIIPASRLSWDFRQTERKRRGITSSVGTL